MRLSALLGIIRHYYYNTRPFLLQANGVSKGLTFFKFTSIFQAYFRDKNCLKPLPEITRFSAILINNY